MSEEINGEYMKSDKEVLELVEKFKKEIFGLDYVDQKRQASLRKIRHHLDMMILHFREK